MIDSKNTPIHQRYSLTVTEAAEYFGIGEKKLREISSGDSCPFVLWVGNKRLIKRRALEKYLDSAYSI